MVLVRSSANTQLPPHYLAIVTKYPYYNPDLKLLPMVLVRSSANTQLPLHYLAIVTKYPYFNPDLNPVPMQTLHNHFTTIT